MSTVSRRAVDLWMGEQTLSITTSRSSCADATRLRFTKLSILVGISLASTLPRKVGGGGAVLRSSCPRSSSRRVRRQWSSPSSPETVDQSMWHFRRDDRIRRPLSEVMTLSRSGLPIVRPEVVECSLNESTGRVGLGQVERHHKPARRKSQWGNAVLCSSVFSQFVVNGFLRSIFARHECRRRLNSTYARLDQVPLRQPTGSVWVTDAGPGVQTSGRCR